jgi:hypothetical protein
VVIVDDHLGLLALAGRLPGLSAEGPVVTTWGFHFRMARAVMDSALSGSLSQRVSDSSAVSRRVLHPPANRLIVLDPRASADQSVRVAVAHRVNLLLAELVGAGARFEASVRVTPANVGRSWAAVMEAEGIDFAAVSL